MKQHIAKFFTTGLALLAFIVVMAGPAQAVPLGYYITGYTGSFTADPTVADVASGYYGITLWGDTTGNSSTRVAGLSASLALYEETDPLNGDFTRNLLNPVTLYNSSLVDIFYLEYAGTVLTLGTNDGTTDIALLQFDFAANSGSDAAYLPALGFTGGYNLLAPTSAFVNTLWAEGSYDPLGNLTSPTTVYGKLMLDGFGATAVNGDLIEMVIDDATVAPVPEPSTFALLGIGVAGVAFWRRKQHTKAA